MYFVLKSVQLVPSLQDLLDIELHHIEHLFHLVLHLGDLGVFLLLLAFKKKEKEGKGQGKEKKFQIQSSARFSK